MIKAILCYFFHKEFRLKHPFWHPFIPKNSRIIYCIKCSDYRVGIKQLPII